MKKNKDVILKNLKKLKYRDQLRSQKKVVRPKTKILKLKNMLEMPV